MIRFHLPSDGTSEVISGNLLERGRYVDVVHSLLVTMARYGRHPDLSRFARYRVLPFTEADPRSALPHWRDEIERLRDLVG